MKSFGLVISWPQTKCRQANSWYDPIMKWIGLNKNSHYAIGHSALVLINPKNGSCIYYDFGRYNTPKHLGRVRSSLTDEDLKITTKAVITDNRVINQKEILTELQLLKAKKGEGPLLSKPLIIDYSKATKRIEQLVEVGYYSYGPFILKGLNCSRFVNKVIIASITNPFQKSLYHFNISPSPQGILKRTLSKRVYIPHTTNGLPRALKLNY